MVYMCVSYWGLWVCLFVRFSFVFLFRSFFLFCFVLFFLSLLLFFSFFSCVFLLFLFLYWHLFGAVLRTKSINFSSLKFRQNFRILLRYEDIILQTLNAIIWVVLFLAQWSELVSEARLLWFVEKFGADRICSMHFSSGWRCLCFCFTFFHSREIMRSWVLAYAYCVDVYGPTFSWTFEKYSRDWTL